MPKVDEEVIVISRMTETVAKDEMDSSHPT